MTPTVYTYTAEPTQQEETNFKVIKKEELKILINEKLIKINETFSLPMNLTQKILEVFNYKEDKIEAALSSGDPIEIMNTILGYANASKVVQASECILCLSANKDGIIKLDCGHKMHQACLDVYVKDKIGQNIESICPSCHAYIPITLLSSISPELSKQNSEKRINFFCKQYQHIIICYKCGNYIKKQDSYEGEVDCTCGAPICSLCKLKYHFPLNCMEKACYKDLYGALMKKHVTDLTKLNTLKLKLEGMASDDSSLKGMVKNISFCKNMYIYGILHPEVETFLYINTFLQKIYTEVEKGNGTSQISKNITPLINSILNIKMNFSG